MNGQGAASSELYFEDLVPGRRFASRWIELTAEDIIDFARKYDPQPFHLDREAGRRSPLGDLAASGWHTASVFMRLYVDGLLHRAASLGSPGVEELRWLKPVRPGDTLRARLTIVDAAPSRSNPGRGTLYLNMEAYNQRDETVMTMKARGLFARRDTR